MKRWLFAWLCLGCTDVADERAARDLEVGHAKARGIEVDVTDGLAVIRSLEPENLTLWSSAPRWNARVKLVHPNPLNVEVRNIVRGSWLQVVGNDGVATRLEPFETPLPTRARFHVSNPGEEIELRLMAPEDATEPLRFSVLGDVQDAVDRVSDVFDKMAIQPDLAFAICVGDWTSRGGRGELEFFESKLEELPIPFYGTLGNHELGTSPPPYQEVFGRGSFHFHYRDVAFSLVDSGNATLAQRSYGWLKEWLNEDRSRVHVFVTHFPPIDPIGVRNGSFASRPEAHALIAKLAEGRVDLSLHGHVHSFYAFELGGIPAYISGGGGALPEKFDGIGRHFLVVSVTPEGRKVPRISSVEVVRVD